MCSPYNIPASGLKVWYPILCQQAFYRYRLVTMGVSHLPFHELYAGIVARAIELVDKDVVIIASGDLSIV